jgi:predicted transcriptional regulator
VDNSDLGISNTSSVINKKSMVIKSVINCCLKIKEIENITDWMSLTKIGENHRNDVEFG